MSIKINMLWNRFFKKLKVLVRIIDFLGEYPFKALLAIIVFYFVDYFWQFEAAFLVTIVLIFLFLTRERKIFVYRATKRLLFQIGLALYGYSGKAYSFFRGKFIGDLSKYPLKVLLVVTLFFIVNYFWHFQAAFWATLFFLILIFDWSSKIFFGFGLVFILLAPLLLLKLKISEIETYVTYGYYFLFLGVLSQIIEYLKDKVVNFLFKTKVFVKRKD